VPVGIVVTLTPTDPTFVPVNSLNPWETCTTGCRQKYTVTISPASVRGTISFALYSSAFVGDSTNRCFRPDGSTDSTCTDAINSAPDYFLDKIYTDGQEPGNVLGQPSDPFQIVGLWAQTIQTTSTVNSADVWVTSRDYGGYGWVGATVTVNGTQYTAIVQQTNWPTTALPIDNNQNFIPDACETSKCDSFGGGGLSTLSASADSDPNPNGAPFGDGFSTFEEYRGFVVIDATLCAPGCTRHIRTDPFTQDVFVVDHDSVFATYSGILRTNTPFFEYHLLSIDLANPNDKVGLDPLKGVGPLRVSYTNHSSDVFAFDVAVDPQLDDQFRCVPQPAGQPQSRCVLGTGSPGNNHNDGFPVRISMRNISDSTRDGFDTTVLTKEVLAHEVGHKFGLNHYRATRPVEPTLAAGTNAFDLQQGNVQLPALRYAPCYAPPCGVADPNHQKFYVWHQVFHKADGTVAVQNIIAQPQTGDLANIGLITSLADGTLLADTPATTDNIVQYTVPIAFSPQGMQLMLPNPPSQIDIWIQRFELMDWTPRRSMVPVNGIPNMNNADAWHFDPLLDLPFMSLCLQESLGCPQ
jgi:hypothetical protein